MLGFQYDNHFNLIGAWNTADLLNNTELGTSVHFKAYTEHGISLTP